MTKLRQHQGLHSSCLWKSGFMSHGLWASFGTQIYGKPLEKGIYLFIPVWYVYKGRENIHMYICWCISKLFGKMSLLSTMLTEELKFRGHENLLHFFFHLLSNQFTVKLSSKAERKPNSNSPFFLKKTLKISFSIKNIRFIRIKFAPYPYFHKLFDVHLRNQKSYLGNRVETRPKYCSLSSFVFFLKKALYFQGWCLKSQSWEFYLFCFSSQCTVLKINCRMLFVPLTAPSYKTHWRRGLQTNILQNLGPILANSYYYLLIFRQYR